MVHIKRSIKNVRGILGIYATKHGVVCLLYQHWRAESPVASSTPWQAKLVSLMFQRYILSHKTSLQTPSKQCPNFTSYLHLFVHTYIYSFIHMHLIMHTHPQIHIHTCKTACEEEGGIKVPWLSSVTLQSLETLKP